MIMGLFDFLFKNRNDKGTNLEKCEMERAVAAPACKGKVSAQKIDLDASCADQLRREFIAFDVETTGLSPLNDRIVEIGALLFSNGEPVKTFSTLVNPNISISASASAVNHITNAMLKSAPSEDEVYKQFIEFLGEARIGNIIMCAHNAGFDFGFLSNTLSRLGYDANLKYVDTLSLAKKYVCGLENYKQRTLESHFFLSNAAAHRASSDAENCGRILLSIIDCADAALEKERKRIELITPAEEELSVCAYIQNVISENGGDTTHLRFRKNSGSYVDATCLYTFIKFKFAKKGRYVILEKSVASKADLPSEPCPASEGGTNYVRVYFSSTSDLKPFSKDIFDLYKKSQKSMLDYTSYNRHTKHEAEEMMHQMKSLTADDVIHLLDKESQRELEQVVATAFIKVEKALSRDSVSINVFHSRVPLSEIKNADDWSKGFDAGFRYYEKGEEIRKDGRIEEAIALFDKARFNGYNAPALYNAYAVAYRQMKDFDNEILILEEGMARNPKHAGIMEARRDKALKLLYARQDAMRKMEEKKQAKTEKESSKIKESVSRQPRGRAILQMTDEGIIINEFETIAAAVRETGISSKSVRDAANGVQKHAGGYCWAYKNIVNLDSQDDSAQLYF